MYDEHGILWGLRADFWTFIVFFKMCPSVCENNDISAEYRGTDKTKGAASDTKAAPVGSAMLNLCELEKPN